MQVIIILFWTVLDFIFTFKGSEEGEVTSQLFGRLSLTLMRGNALMLSTRCQDADFPLPEVDGVE